MGNPNKTYNLLEIDEICDAFLSGYTAQRELTEFKKTGLNFSELNDYCWEYLRINYLFHFHGDTDKILAHVDSSKLMSELTYYMKRRLDADMTEEDEDKNYKDYSIPKMLMISGHDSTTSADEIFMLNALDLNISENYIFPKYAAQLALEVRTKKEPSQKTSYADYYVVGYFNDKQIFNVTADKFITKVEGEIWSQEKINEFCGFDETNSDGKNSSNSSNSNGGASSDDVSSKKKDKAKTAYKALMIVFICLTALLLASTIYLAYKLSKRSPPPLDPNFSVNKTNITMNDIK